MVPTESIEHEEAAQQNLRHILDAITEADGPEMTTDVIEALRAAIREGRIDGSLYSGPENTNGAMIGCVIGQIAQVRGTWCNLNPVVPGWDGSYAAYDGGLAPLERFVLHVQRGETAVTDVRLARLASWLEGATA
jgi:hypothetical protein